MYDIASHRLMTTMVVGPVSRNWLPYAALIGAARWRVQLDLTGKRFTRLLLVTKIKFFRCADPPTLDTILFF